MVNKGNHPQMAQLFRCVKYFHLPRTTVNGCIKQPTSLGALTQTLPKMGWSQHKIKHLSVVDEAHTWYHQYITNISPMYFDFDHFYHGLTWPLWFAETLEPRNLRRCRLVTCRFFSSLRGRQPHPGNQEVLKLLGEVAMKWRITTVELKYV